MLNQRLNDVRLIQAGFEFLLIRKMHHGQKNVLKEDLVIVYLVGWKQAIDDSFCCDGESDLRVFEQEGKSLRDLPLDKVALVLKGVQ